MKKYIVLLFSLLSLYSEAQNYSCPTEFTPVQMKNLRDFQQKLEKGEVSLNKKSMVYVPMHVNIVGNSKGEGYYSISFLMRTLCELNERFIPTGFHFFLADSIRYINDDELYVGNSDAIWTRAEEYKTPGVVNVFFHGQSNEWCGVYFGGVDVVFINKVCQGENATTLTHELGHFFGLPHTFSGWEGGNTPGVIEKMDGSNCRNSGDGFCDTKPDYVSSRWSCPYKTELIDPNGVHFRPDSSIYMNYSLDACHKRFSTEQMLEMQSNLQMRLMGQSSVDLRKLNPPLKISPAPKEQEVNADFVKLSWHPVEGAFAYHVQIARFGDWNYLNYDQLVYDTTVFADLFGDWNYAWRVKAITAANTCSDFGSVDTFSTKQLPNGVKELFVKPQATLYPNPVQKEERIMLKTEAGARVILSNEMGQELANLQADSSGEISFQVNASGLYFIQLKLREGNLVKRLSVQ